MRFFEFKETKKMKGGTDLNKFMGYKGKDLADPSNRKLPKVISIDPFTNSGSRKKKRGYYDIDGKDYYYEDEDVNESLRQHTSNKNYPGGDIALAVQQLQHILMVLGYNVGKAGVDGKYGPTTAKAVASFKKDYNVPGGGDMFGPKALAVLKKVIAGEEKPKKPTSFAQSAEPSFSNDAQDSITPPGGGALFTMDGASRMADRDAADNIKKLLAGPYRKMVKLFGQDVPIRDAIAKSGSTREKSTKGSMHFSGLALDLNISGYNDSDKLKLVQAAKQAGFKGFGFGRNTLHVDIGRNRYWSYDNSTYAGVRVADLGKYVTSGIG